LGADKENCPQPILQLLDLVAKSWLGDFESLGGFAETALLRDRHKGYEMTKLYTVVHSCHNLSSGRKVPIGIQWLHLVWCGRAWIGCPTWYSCLKGQATNLRLWRFCGLRPIGAGYGVIRNEYWTRGSDNATVLTRGEPTRSLGDQDTQK
jgi:hypothetical protein